jgi:hypothetical protein
MKNILLIALALAACTDHLAPITGTQSLKVELTSPADPGSITNRLAPTARTVSLTITALDVDGNTDTTFNNTLQVYVQYLGTLTPYLGMPPLATVPMSAGQGKLTNFMLPPVFGPTEVWLDDGTDANATFATGVSPTLWFADPLIDDIRTPNAPPTSPDYFQVGPVDNKNVSVQASRYGANGRLVLTSVYPQGYTVADVNCSDANGTPPCTSMPFDFIDVFSYSAPLDQQKRFLSEGEVIDGFAGGVGEFNGLLEIGFPQTFVNTATPDIQTAREPAPMKVDSSWFTNIALFKQYEAAALEIDNATVCNLDADYMQYKQWKLDLSGTGGNCTGSLINVVSQGIPIDPATLVGKKIAKVVGIERSINIGTKHIWIIYPRGLSDITVP